MSSSKIAWRSSGRDVGLVEAGAGVELDLAVLRAIVSRSNRMTRPSLMPAPPDAPFVHQGGRVGLGLLGRDVVAPEGLGVDDDLGLRLGLDGVDDLFGLGAPSPGWKTPA